MLVYSDMSNLDSFSSLSSRVSVVLNFEVFKFCCFDILWCCGRSVPFLLQD